MIKKIPTKDLIAQSLLELLNKNSIQSISVKDICDNCGLNIRTFYLHYVDKHDAVNYIYYQMNESCWYTNDQPNSLKNFFEAIVAYGNTTYRKFYLNTFCYHGQNNIREYIRSKGILDLERLLKWNGYDYAISDDIRNSLNFYMLGLIGFEERNLYLPVSQAEDLLNIDPLKLLPNSVAEYILEDNG